MTAAASSDAFFADVRRFFTLLDLDGDSVVSYAEATLGLSHCFDAVHRVHSPSSSISTSHPPPDDAPPISAAQKAQTVANQVQWLFSATQTSPPSPSPPSPSPSLPPPLTLPQFELCYQRLLQSAYEQEVLHLDLKRAINSLHSSQQWTAMRGVLSRARRVWMDRVEGAGGGGREGVVQAVVERSMRSLGEGGSGVFGSAKKAAAAKRVVDGVKAKGGAIGLQEWMGAWQDIVAVDFRHQPVLEDLDQVLAG